jgi:glycosyltransferase involved in cell wall biosynthesis
LKLLYFAPATSGGLADYAREQANALAQLGVELNILSSDRFPLQPDDRFKLRSTLITEVQGQSKLSNRLASARSRLRHYHQLSNIVATEKYRHVLLGAFAEYLAPLWSWRLARLARHGVVFGAVVHDPVRDYIVGPLWWHRRSITTAYSFVREAFVHEEIQLDTVRPMPGLRTTVIPHGPYHFPEPKESPMSIRKRLRLPDHAYVALSFGHIRDGKNLNLVIQAMTHLPSVHLIVAGKEQSSGQKPIGYYQNLARTLQVHDRCHWIHGHIPEEEVGNLFIVSDLILLTYSRDFRSASGVLNAAVSFRKPCVASSGGGNLRSVVERHQLGWFVEPDNLLALESGIKAALQNEINPQWETYQAENSWVRNAQIVKGKIFEK